MPQAKRAVLVTLMLTCVVLFAGKNELSGIEVAVELTDPPEVEYRRSETPAVKSDSENRWLKIGVKYMPPREAVTPPVLQRERGKLYLNRSGFLDGMSVKLRVLIDTGIKFGSRPVYGMYTGEVKFYTVRCDGKKHLIEMFVPRKLIDRFSLSPSGALRRVQKKDFVIEVVFTAGGREIGRCYSGVASERDFASACELIPGNMVLTGGVLPRSRTPWALLEADGFDPEIVD